MVSLGPAGCLLPSPRCLTPYQSLHPPPHACRHLNDSAYLTGWLLALISAGAAVCSALFPRRFWCRHLCPIGGMNGTMARLSAVELRSQAGVCSAEW